MESTMNSSREEVQQGNNIDIKAIGKNMSSEEDERNSASASPLFECPISLQVMSDPVTLCTGLTYDRTSIQKWRRLRPGNNICPLTGQTLHTRDLIPNRTLAALIQKWRLTDPEAEENKKLLKHMITQIDKGDVSCKIGALRELRNLARDESDRSHLQSEGVVPALIRVIEGFNNDPAEKEAEAAVQEAIATIVLFSVDDPICSRDLTSGPAIRTVEWVLAKGDLESRINAAALVEKLAKADDAAAAEMGSREGITEALFTLLQHDKSLHSSLRALVRLCRVVSYRVKLAEAVGFIPLAIRALMGDSERGVTEASMAVLEALSTVCQGRCGIMADSVAVTAIVGNLVHVSRVATAHGVGILLNLCKNCNKEDEIRELVRSGILQKLVALLHMDCEPRTKKRVNLLIKILSPLENYDSCAQFVIHLAFICKFGKVQITWLATMNDISRLCRCLGTAFESNWNGIQWISGSGTAMESTRATFEILAKQTMVKKLEKCFILWE